MPNLRTWPTMQLSESSTPGKNTRRRLPWPVLTALAMVLITLGAIVGCGSESTVVATRGRVLEVYADVPQVTDRLSYVKDGRHFVLRPKASNRRLAVVKVTVVNRTSTIIPIVIDAEALRLGDRRGERIKALHPFEDAVAVEDSSPDEGKFTPFLWGDLEMPRFFQASGWVVFDVPRGLKLGSLFWDEVDTITVDYSTYFLE